MEATDATLLAGDHFAAIAKQSHFAATVPHFLNKSCITECMDCRLAIQKYTVSEIKGSVRIGRLVEIMFNGMFITCFIINIAPVNVLVETHLMV